MKLAWIVHGVPLGLHTNATPADDVKHYNYTQLFYTPDITNASETWHKDILSDNTIAYTICHGSGGGHRFMDTNGRGGSYAGVTLFIKDGYIPNEQRLLTQLSTWFNREILAKFTTTTPSGDLRWRADVSNKLFNNAYDAQLTDRMLPLLTGHIIDKSAVQHKQITTANKKSIQDATKRLQQEIANLEHELLTKRTELAQMQTNEH